MDLLIVPQVLSLLTPHLFRQPAGLVASPSFLSSLCFYLSLTTAWFPTAPSYPLYTEMFVTRHQITTVQNDLKTNFNCPKWYECICNFFIHLVMLLLKCLIILILGCLCTSMDIHGCILICVTEGLFTCVYVGKPRLTLSSLFFFTVISMESSLQIMLSVWRCGRFSSTPQMERQRLSVPQPISLWYACTLVC